MKKFKKTDNLYNRRNFLGSCGKMTSISLLSSILQLKMTNSALAQLSSNQLGGYKALVCVFLNGGNDSHNMLIPFEAEEHERYAAAKGALSIDRADMLFIRDTAGDRRGFGIHPSMPEVQTLFNQSSLAFIANVGTLVRPTSLSDFEQGVALPRALFSHREQSQSWQTSIPEDIGVTGWAGRMAEIVTSSGVNTGSVRMNISTSGSNLWQTGRGVNPLVIGESGANSAELYTDQPSVRNGMNASLEFSYRSVIKNHYNSERRNILEQNEEYADVTEGLSVSTNFPNSSLGRQLRQVALAIAGRDRLGARRQTFFVSIGSFDFHSDQTARHNELMTELSQGLKAFDDAMIELGVHDEVTTYTASDFGRSVTNNGDGSDHGWGGNQIVMGGAVNGRRLYGEYPEDLGLGSDTDTGRGRQLPTTSVDVLHGELATWYGIPNDGNLEDILPNIRNFWGRNRSPILGFLD